MPTNFDELVLKTKQSKILSSSLLFSAGSWLSPIVDVQSMALEGYCQNPDVYSCIHLKQKAVAGIPVQVLQIATDGTKKVLKDPRKNPLVSLIQRPNPDESWPMFIEHILGDLDHAGDAYIERVGPEKYEKTRPRELHLLPPGQMRIIRGDARQPISGYKWGGQVDFKPWQVLHLKYYNPRDYFYGLSPISACANAIDQNNAAAKWNYSLFKNAGRPSGILTLSEEVIGESSMDDITKELGKHYIGQENAGQVIVLPSDTKWTTTSFSPLDMDFRNMTTENTRKIASVFGVPAQLIGDETNRNYSNFSESRQAFYKETILPTMDWLMEELTNWLAPLYGGNYQIAYDQTAIEAISEDTHALYDRILRAVAGGILTPNEGRSVLGYPLVKGGDERLIPWNLAPESIANNPNRALAKSGAAGTQTPQQPQAGRPSINEQPSAPGNSTKREPTKSGL